MGAEFKHWQRLIIIILGFLLIVTNGTHSSGQLNRQRNFFLYSCRRIARLQLYTRIFLNIKGRSFVAKIISHGRIYNSISISGGKQCIFFLADWEENPLVRKLKINVQFAETISRKSLEHTKFFMHEISH